MHPVEVVLAVEFLAIDLLSHGARHALQHRYGIEKGLPISVRQGPDLSSNVLDRDGKALLGGDLFAISSISRRG